MESIYLEKHQKILKVGLDSGKQFDSKLRVDCKPISQFPKELFTDKKETSSILLKFVKGII